MKIATKVKIITLATHSLAVWALMSWQSWSASLLLWFAFWYLFSSFGVTVALHRYFTHKSFVATRPLKVLLGVMGMSSLRGPIDFWVGMHRSHHRNADRTDADSHLDPYNAGLGFWNGYMGWLLKIEDAAHFVEKFRLYAEDVTRDPDLRFMNKKDMDLYFNIVLGLISWLMFGMLGVAATIGLRLALVHQAVYLTNSLGHGHGPFNYRNFSLSDRSTNNLLISLFTFGDGWHNNHHAYPKSARNTYRAWEFDPSWWFIRVMRRLGLVTEVWDLMPRPKGCKAAD